MEIYSKIYDFTNANSSYTPPFFKENLLSLSFVSPPRKKGSRKKAIEMGKLKNGERSWGNPDTRPSFYQIILSKNMSELKIPTEFFNEHLASEENEKVVLKSFCGSWEAEVERRDGEGVYLVGGWREFVESHGLGRAELAVFMYNGGMSFDVSIYESNGCLKEVETKDAPQEFAPPFASSLPFFRHKMKAHNVGPKCIMLIPKKFSRKHMSMSKQTMMLRDSDGVSWAVTTTITAGGHLALCGGWKAFTDAHSIKEGDVCIFELVEEKLMRFHVL